MINTLQTDYKNSLNINKYNQSRLNARTSGAIAMGGNFKLLIKVAF